MTGCGNAEGRSGEKNTSWSALASYKIVKAPPDRGRQVGYSAGHQVIREARMRRDSVSILAKQAYLL
jgi:hypothetical protein